MGTVFIFFQLRHTTTPHPHHHHAPPPQSAATGTLLSEWSGRVHVCHIRHLLTSDALPRLLCLECCEETADNGSGRKRHHHRSRSEDPLSKGAQAASRHSSSFSFSRFHRLFLFPCTTSSSGRSNSRSRSGRSGRSDCDEAAAKRCSFIRGHERRSNRNHR